MTTSKISELDYGHIYIIELDKHKELYKIGKTNKLKIKDRIKQYPKNVKLIFSWECPIVSNCEQQIISVFLTKFKKYDSGREYFIGKIDDMLIEINLIINNFNENLNIIKNQLFHNQLEKDQLLEQKMTMNELSGIADECDISLDAQDELYEFNIVNKYNRLEKIKDKLNNYDKAVYIICEVLIDNVNHDKHNGDYYSEKNNSKIKEAGKLLYSYDGNSVMRDVLFAWIPKRYRREIEYLWDGIGEWYA
jgi:hypothetical protein